MSIILVAIGICYFFLNFENTIFYHIANYEKWFFKALQMANYDDIGAPYDSKLMKI